MRKLALFSIKIYKQLRVNFPSQCIFHPTCSEYAQEAFLRHSFFKAFKLTVSRIFRCNPLSKGGYDPVI